MYNKIVVMKLLYSRTFKKIRFEIAMNWQINIGISWGKPWVNGDEKFYIWTDFLCFNTRTSILK